MDIKIRKYKKDDYEYLASICRETANPNYSSSKVGLKLVTLVWLDYFTTYKSELISVAVDENDHPIGYILCANDYKHYIRTMKNEFFPKMKELRKEEIPSFKTYMLSLFILRKHFTHLHIDILDDYQKMGIGKRLINSLIDTLKANNEHSLAVMGVSVGTPGYYFYKKVGFKTVIEIPNKFAFFRMEF